MDDFILIESDDSENSIVEVEVPKKPTPPLIEVDDDEMILNIEKKSKPNLTLMAKDVIEEQILPHSSQGCPTQASSPDHWTSDMIKFYNDDWGDEEQFIVEKIQEKMDKSSYLWEISKKDYCYMNRSAKKNRLKCWNCFQYGHSMAFCPDPPHVPKCHMCGTPGHLDNSCPNAKCLNCGNPLRHFSNVCHKCYNHSVQTCSRCKLVGHNFINCSDHWRLFHYTTGTESVKIPENNVYKKIEDMWCCNCGRKGHIHTQCRLRRDNSEFTETTPFVISYKKAFTNPIYKEKYHGGKFNKKFQEKDKVMRMNPKNKFIKKAKKNRNKRFKKKERKDKMFEY